MIFGMAMGSWLSGVIIDRFGVQLTAMLPVIVVLIALIIAKLSIHKLFRSIAPIELSNSEEKA